MQGQEKISVYAKAVGTKMQIIMHKQNIALSIDDTCPKNFVFKFITHQLHVIHKPNYNTYQVLK